MYGNFSKEFCAIVSQAGGGYNFFDGLPRKQDNQMAGAKHIETDRPGRYIYLRMKALKEMGKRIPEDVAVIGFDDMPFSRITNPPLSSVRQPMFEMGKLGAKMLIDAVKKKDFSHQYVKLGTELIPRQSVKKELMREKLLC